MSDLISRSAAIAQIERRGKYLGGDKRVSVESFKNFLRDRPAVDAEPVRHGRWIEHIEIGAMNNHYECSACHWKTPSFTIARDSNYCPNCGTKMDGGM